MARAASWNAAAGEEIEITKHDRTVRSHVARLVPAAGARALRGSLAAGVAMIAAEDERLFFTEAAWNAT